MTANGLARHYDGLSRRERTALYVEATSRGDDVEAGRLSASAPKMIYEFPDCFMPSMGLHILTLMYIGEQLESIAGYWHAVFRLGETEDEESLRTWQLAHDCYLHMVK